MNVQAAIFASGNALGSGAAGVAVIAQTGPLPDWAQLGISGAILAAWLLTIKWSYSFMGRHIDRNTDALSKVSDTVSRIDSRNAILHSRMVAVLERIERRLDER